MAQSVRTLPLSLRRHLPTLLAAGSALALLVGGVGLFDSVLSTTIELLPLIQALCSVLAAVRSPLPRSLSATEARQLVVSVAIAPAAPSRVAPSSVPAVLCSK